MSLRFLREFLKSPASIGAIWPSSRSLARRMVSLSNLHEADFVLELGPGTGSFTEKIFEALPRQARFAAVEKNAKLAEKVSHRFPEALVIVGCATHLTRHLREKNLEKPHAILSGLPWATFDSALQKTILNEVAQTLVEGGVFTTFAYYGPHWLKGGKMFRKNLNDVFGDVRRSPVVLANLPPAFVYYCRK